MPSSNRTQCARDSRTTRYPLRLGLPWPGGGPVRLGDEAAGDGVPDGRADDEPWEDDGERGEVPTPASGCTGTCSACAPPRSGSPGGADDETPNRPATMSPRDASRPVPSAAPMTVAMRRRRPEPSTKTGSPCARTATPPPFRPSAGPAPRPEPTHVAERREGTAAEVAPTAAVAGGYDAAARLAASYPRCRKSAAATAVAASATSRVSRGANTRPPASAVATHTSVQNGQLTNSPTACWVPVPRGRSLSSASPAGSTYRVNGARSGLVTASLVSRRDSLWVAIPSRATSIGRTSRGGRRPVSRARPASPPTTVPYTPITVRYPRSGRPAPGAYPVPPVTTGPVPRAPTGHPLSPLYRRWSHRSRRPRAAVPRDPTGPR